MKRVEEIILVEGNDSSVRNYLLIKQLPEGQEKRGSLNCNPVIFPIAVVSAAELQNPIDLEVKKRDRREEKNVSI